MHVEHPVARTGFAEQSAKLERRRAEKRLANTARRETGCKIDWDFRSDPRTVTAPPGRGVRSLFLRRNVGRQPPTSHPPHVRRRWDIRTPPNTVLDTPSDRYNGQHYVLRRHRLSPSIPLLLQHKVEREGMHDDASCTNAEAGYLSGDGGYGPSCRAPAPSAGRTRGVSADGPL